MKTTIDSSKIFENITIDSEKKFVEEYQEIFKSSENTVVVKNEWVNNGDYFEKLSIYDNSYSTILTFGNSTIIK